MQVLCRHKEKKEMKTTVEEKIAHALLENKDVFNDYMYVEDVEVAQGVFVMAGAKFVIYDTLPDNFYWHHTDDDITDDDLAVKVTIKEQAVYNGEGDPADFRPIDWDKVKEILEDNLL